MMGTTQRLKYNFINRRLGGSLKHNHTETLPKFQIKLEDFTASDVQLVNVLTQRESDFNLDSPNDELCSTLRATAIGYLTDHQLIGSTQMQRKWVLFSKTRGV